MRFMRLAAVAVMAIAAATTAQAKDWTTVRIGTEGAYPPFNSITSSGELVGFDIDIAKALCDQMKVKCEFVTQDWDGMIPALTAGKFDAIIASMSITDERKQKVLFSKKYYQTPPAIVVRKDSNIAGVTDADLKGKVLGAQSSTTHAAFAEKTFPDAEVKVYPTADEYKLDLADGRIDGVVDDVVVLSDWLKTKDGSCCKLLGTLTPDPAIYGEGIGIAMRKEDGDLKAMFDKAIDEIRANGKYKEVNDKYFDFDAYGD